ncbi:hypothetical protein C8J56DRAFT_1053070 [Mycena floridula]|nr:hypothetical protein C8J56DRAFT_1053070 [Mycena floridula]
MEAHSLKYQFPVVDMGTTAFRWMPSSGPLELLQLSNQGRPTKLCPSHYSHYSLGFKQPATAEFALNNLGLGTGLPTDNIPIRHSCLDRQFYADRRFRYDSSNYIRDLPTELLEQNVCTCFEQESSTPEPEALIPVMDQPIAVPAPINEADVTPVIPTPHFWGNSFVKRTGDHRITSQNFTDDIFRAANLGRTPTRLRVSADSFEEAADQLLSVVRTCREQQDYSDLLSPRRLFNVRQGNTASGDGVDSKTVTTLFERYRRNPSANFKLLHSEQASLCFSMPMRFAGTISRSHLDYVEDLGSIVGLMVAYGKCPDPHGAGFLQYMLNDCDINALDKQFIAEWDPHLHSIIQRIDEAGPQGDLAFADVLFQSYCDSSAASMADRTPEMHAGLANSRLFYVVSNLEQLMDLLFLMQAIHSLPGGTRTFLSTLVLSHVTEYGSIRDTLAYQVDTTLWNNIKQAFNIVDCPEFTTFPSIIGEFLSGRGIPLPDKWEAAKVHFSSDIPLDNVDKVHFRPRYFTWAVTGSPELKPALVSGEQRIKASQLIVLCDKDDLNYTDGAVDETTSGAMGNASIFCIHTCINYVAIPSNYLLSMDREAIRANGLDMLSPSHRARALKKHIFHWLLAQTLNAIGKVSILYFDT